MDGINTGLTLKNGVDAMRMPKNTLESNYAYMTIACYSWNLKAWFGLSHPNALAGRASFRMKFPTYIAKLMHVVCQILTQARNPAAIADPPPVSCLSSNTLRIRRELSEDYEYCPDSVVTRQLPSG